MPSFLIIPKSVSRAAVPGSSALKLHCTRELLSCPAEITRGCSCSLNFVRVNGSMSTWKSADVAKMKKRVCVLGMRECPTAKTKKLSNPFNLNLIGQGGI